MKNILFLLILLSGFCKAQMPDVSRVWLNDGTPYKGTISKKNIPIKVKYLVSEQNRNNDQEYFISGISVVERSLVKFEGKIKITKYKDRRKKSAVYGEYEFAEENKGSHSGIFKGKFIFTFDWNEKKQAVENKYIEFIGDWKSYDGTMSHKTQWDNQEI